MHWDIFKYFCNQSCHWLKYWATGRGKVLAEIEQIKPWYQYCWSLQLPVVSSSTVSIFFLSFTLTLTWISMQGGFDSFFRTPLLVLNINFVCGIRRIKPDTGDLLASMLYSRVRQPSPMCATVRPGFLPYRAHNRSTLLFDFTIIDYQEIKVEWHWTHTGQRRWGVNK